MKNIPTMATNPTLLTLQEQKLCDEQTVEALSKEDPFIQTSIQNIAKGYKNFTENRTAPGETKQATQAFGSTLLFLEDLLQEPQEIQHQVKTWLEDEKRAFLFSHSPQGQLYGQLLTAQAKGELEIFKEEYNEGIPAQQPFTLEETLAITLQDNPRAKTNIPTEKIDAVLTQVKQNLIGELNKQLAICTDPKNLKELQKSQEAYDYLDKMRNPQIKDNKKYSFKALNAFKRIVTILDTSPNILAELGSSDLSPEEQLVSLYRTLTDSQLPANHQIVQNELEEIVQRVYQFETEEIDTRLDILKEGIVKGLEIDYAFSLQIEEYRSLLGIKPQDLAELTTLKEEVVAIVRDKHKVADKFKPEKKVTYTLELSAKNPLDVTFGNDSGACIAVSPNTNDISNAYGLPHTIADNAQYIFNILQQIGQGKKRRVGITYAVAAENDEGKKAFAGNSIELSAHMNPREVLEPLVAFIEKGLEVFGKREGHEEGFMSNHAYNTSQNYSAKAQEKPHFPALRKPRRKNEPPYYSEIVRHKPVLTNLKGHFSVIDSEDGFYRLW